VYLVDLVILILCLIFLINVIVDTIIKEGLEDDNDNYKELSKISIIMIFFLLFFEINRNLVFFFIILIIMILLMFYLSNLDKINAVKLRDINKKISENIMDVWLIVGPTYIILYIIAKILGF